MVRITQTPDMIMKAINIFKYFLTLAAVLCFASCQEEPYSPGTPDDMDCHGVFFPQTQAKAYELSPEDPNYLTFTVERTLAYDEAFVPFEITSSVEDFFELEDEFIYFDEDQTKTTFKVYFSKNYETGKKYDCTIKVTDPLYVANYGLSSPELTFSLTVVEWELLGDGLWRDDFFTSYGEAIGAVLEAPYHEKTVQVYERQDLKGYYRVDGIYTPDYIAYIADGNTNNAAAYNDFCPATSIYINAVDPSKVYIDAQFAFYDPSPYGYGAVYICSDVQEVFTSGYSNLYGTLKDGSITFPKKALVAYLPSAGSAYANNAGKQRLVLPGHRPYDYSVAVSVSPSVDGVMPVEFVIGEDVAKVEYQVFKGHLSDVEMVSKLEEVKGGKNVETITEGGVYEYTSSETGFYTLIACSYDAADNFKEYDFVKFGYDTAEDPKDVDIHFGLIVSDKYAGAGLTKENSMEFYVYGSEITSAKVAMYKKANYDDFKESIDTEFEYYIAPLGREELSQVNGAGYSGVINGLTPGTEYILIVYADNGYHSGTFYTTKFTEGEFDLLDAEYNVYDIPERLQTDKEAYFKEWDLWSLDPFKATSWGRTKRSTVTIGEDKDLMYDVNDKLTEDESKAETIIDLVEARGVHPNAAEIYKFEDKIQFEFYKGFIYTMMTQMTVGEYKGSPIYPTNAYLFFDGSGLTANLENGALIGGFLTEEQDAIAFVGNPRSEAGRYGYPYVAMMLCYFTSPDYTGNAPLIEEDCHAYPLLISPDSDYADDPETLSTLKAPAACTQLSVELSKPRRNYVESSRGYILSTIDKLTRGPRNYMDNVYPMTTFIDREIADFTMRKSMSSSVAKTPSGLDQIERSLR
jgi:hypothetical protein